MDVQMPEMDGFEATRLIQAESPLCAEAPILGMTAHASASARKACRESGMCDVLTKPIRRDAFLATVDRWIRYAAGEADAAAEDSPAQQTAPEPAQTSPMRYYHAIREFGGDRGRVDRLASDLLESVSVQIPVLRDALARQDASTLRTEAHRIRGGAASLTAMPLAEAAASLESFADDDDLEQAVTALAQLQQEFGRLQDFLADRVCPERAPAVSEGGDAL
jgi:CheY-like chemotaxis protein